MRKKALLIIALCALALVGASLFVWLQSHPEIPPKYERTIARNVNSQEEEKVLAAAETIKYSEILSLERFEGSSDPEAYIHPGTYLAYTGAHFIDSEVINYYETRYDSLREKGTPKQIEFTYEANVHNWPEMRFFNSPAPENQNWHNNTIAISAPDGSILFKNAVNIGSGMKILYRNQSGYEMIEPGFDFNFSDLLCGDEIIVFLNIRSSSCFFSNVCQIMVVDHNFVPVLLCVQSGVAMA